MKPITIHNACVHNLKHISLTIPKEKFIVITGVSGSGKSSLAFNVIYNEGRRAYLQAIGVVPDITHDDAYGSVDGISPAVAVKQTLIRDNNPRSVVGSRSRIFNHLRNLFITDGKSDNGDAFTTDYLNFNSMQGMCLQCTGRGVVEEISLDKAIPDHSISLRRLCTDLYTWTKKEGPQVFLQRYGLEPSVSYKDLSDRQRREFLFGFYDRELGRYGGLIPYIKWRAGLSSDKSNKKKLFETVVCDICQGYKLSPEAMSVKLEGIHLGQIGRMTIYEVMDFVQQFQAVAENKDVLVKSRSAINHIMRTSQLLLDVELGHLTLYREMRTLSGGELQRFLQMSYLQAETDSLIYVFDEPTLGLHEIEKNKLLAKIRDLQRLGNTVIVVEHDKNTIEQADYVIDIGPSAGKHGGEIVYEGDYEGLLKCDRSVTGMFLSGKIQFPRKEVKKVNESTPNLQLMNVTTNNLRDVSVNIPLGVRVGVAGVSGSGKSSLITSTLLPTLKAHFKAGVDSELDAEEVEVGAGVVMPLVRTQGLEHLSGFAAVTQSPIGRNKRSIPVSYVEIWDKIRNLFAAQDSARDVGLGAEHFSFNSKGACPLCQGYGVNEKSLGTIGSISGPCPECKGSRYKTEVLSVKYKNKTIHDVLNMDVSEAVDFFHEEAAICQMLQLLEHTGMGYMTLGQPTSSLSGGEAQRVKLAKELGQERKGNILYILDEPTAGLSGYDVGKLLELLWELVSRGNSVIVVEHDPTMLSHCDWIIEMGPGSAYNGGEIIAEGPPISLKTNRNSLIGSYLSSG